jgi:hypothetical protein
MEKFIKAFREYRKADPVFNPKLVYWHFGNQYLVTYWFTNEQIQQRKMEVIHG